MQNPYLHGFWKFQTNGLKNVGGVGFLVNDTWEKLGFEARMDPGVENWRGDNWCERSEHVAWPAPLVRWREASPREQRQGSGAQPPEIFWSLLSVQTTRRSNLALAGRRLNRIFMDSYNKFSRLTLKKWENKN